MLKMPAAVMIGVFTGLLLLLQSWELSAQRCDIVDLGFILDSSGSLKRDYQTEKDFLKQIAARFDISFEGSHAGVVTFSNRAKLSIKLNEYYDKKSFERAVDNIALIGLTTRIDLALRVARDGLFKESNGGRIGVKKVLVLITDGSQTDKPGAVDPGLITDEMRKIGMNTIVVGVGSATNVTELNHLAGGPDKWYKANHFNDLMTTNILETVTFSACPVPVECTSLADIGFILDASGSLRNDFGKEKEFLKRVVSTFGISKDGFHAGVVTFAYEAELSIKFTDHYDSASFDAAVNAIPLDGGQTRIDKALITADFELFGARNGARAHAAKLLILITDGSQSPNPIPVDPGIYADYLRNRGYTIVVLGIGSATDPVELDHLAGGTSKSYRAGSFDQLLKGDYVSEVKKKLGLCTEIVRTQEGPEFQESTAKYIHH